MKDGNRKALVIRWIESGYHPVYADDDRHLFDHFSNGELAISEYNLASFKAVANLHNVEVRVTE